MIKISSLKYLLIVVCGLFLGSSAQAYTFRQTGANSNILIYDNKVCFAQGDGTLTLLNLNTGEALLRKANIDLEFQGQLVLTDNGIFMASSESAMLDKDTLDVIWTAKTCYEPHIDSRILVCNDGYGYIQSRDIRDGLVNWGHNLPYSVIMAAKSGKVALVRKSEFSDSDPSMVALLDLETGRTIFTKKLSGGWKISSAHFDGNRTYLSVGKVEHGRFGITFERLLTLDAAGKEVSFLAVPDNYKKTGYLDKTSALKIYLETNALILDQDQVFAKNEYRQQLNEVQYLTYGEMAVKEYFTNTGKLRIDTIETSEKKNIDVIRYVAGKSEWQGYFRYFNKGEYVDRIASSRDKLIVGTNYGHLECIELGTGRSLWLYSFPTFRRTRSYSSGFYPPDMVFSALENYRDNKRKLPASGLALLTKGSLNDGADLSKCGFALNNPRVILDSKPHYLYTDYKLPVYLLFELFGLILPFKTLRYLNRRKEALAGKNWLSALAYLGGAAVSLITWWFLGRASSVVGFLLQLMVIWYVFRSSIWIYRSYRARQWATATANLILSALFVYAACLYFIEAVFLSAMFIIPYSCVKAWKYYKATKTSER